MIRPTLEWANHWQMLESIEADFGELTWTFRLPSNGWVGAGNYAVIPHEAFANMSTKLAHAEALLRRYLHNDGDLKLREHIESFFDPEPL